MGLFDSLIPFSGLISSIFSALDARANRNFQERMSSTAHQREVRDMMAAGINPMMSARGSGASTPSGATADIKDFGSSAMAAKLGNAQLRLLDAQTLREVASARLSNTQATDISNTAAAGWLRLITSQADIADMNATQLREMMPLQIEQAKAEIARTVSSARAATATAMLDEAARTGALNEQEWQSRIGEMGPAMRSLLMILREIRRR